MFPRNLFYLVFKEKRLAQSIIDKKTTATNFFHGLTSSLYSRVRSLFSKERQASSYEEYRDLLETVCGAKIKKNSAESIAEYLDKNNCFKEIATLVKMGAKLEDFENAFQSKASFETGRGMKELISSLQDINAELVADALLPYCQGEDNNCKKAFLKGYKRIDEVRASADQEEEYVMRLSMC